jgi:hypothetical protein
MVKSELFSLDHMAVVCVVIAGVVEAAQQALISAPNVSRDLPQVFTSPNVNYLPFGLITLAGLLWVTNQFRSRPVEVMSSGDISEPARRQSSLPVAVGPSLPAVVTALEPEPDHSLIDVSPFELSGFFDQHLTAQAMKLLEPYLGKRLRLTTTLVDVYVYEDGHIYVYGTIPSPKDPTWIGMHVNFYFDKKWGSRLIVLKRGNPITAIGEIMEAKSKTIFLRHCELVDDV